MVHILEKNEVHWSQTSLSSNEHGILEGYEGNPPTVMLIDGIVGEEFGGNVQFNSEAMGRVRHTHGEWQWRDFHVGVLRNLMHLDDCFHERIKVVKPNQEHGGGNLAFQFFLNFKKLFLFSIPLGYYILEQKDLKIMQLKIIWMILFLILFF